MSPAAAALAAKPVDLAGVRKGLVRLAGAQMGLLLVVAVAFAFARPAKASGIALLVWMAALPLLIGLWTWSYWSRVTRTAAAAGATNASLAPVNRDALKRLGGIATIWAFVLLAILAWILLGA